MVIEINRQIIGVKNDLVRPHLCTVFVVLIFSIWVNFVLMRKFNEIEGTRRKGIDEIIIKDSISKV